MKSSMEWRSRAPTRANDQRARGFAASPPVFAAIAASPAGTGKAFNVIVF
jgi:hypothetical protein